jgi:hypothetical protein
MQQVREDIWQAQISTIRAAAIGFLCFEMKNDLKSVCGVFARDDQVCSFDGLG